MRISDWSSDVCSSDLLRCRLALRLVTRLIAIVLLLAGTATALDLDIHRLQAARERSVLRIIVAGETDGIALGVLDQFLIRERHRLHLIERKAGSIRTHLHFLVTTRPKDCTSLTDDGKQLRRRTSTPSIQH